MKRIFPLLHAVGFIAQMNSIASILVFYLQSVDTIVTVSVTGILLRKYIKREGSVLSSFIRIS
jgi:hypothetical protein